MSQKTKATLIRMANADPRLKKTVKPILAALELEKAKAESRTANMAWTTPEEQERAAKAFAKDIAQAMERQGYGARMNESRSRYGYSLMIRPAEDNTYSVHVRSSGDHPGLLVTVMANHHLLRRYRFEMEVPQKLDPHTSQMFLTMGPRDVTRKVMQHLGNLEEVLSDYAADSRDGW